MHLVFSLGWNTEGSERADGLAKRGSALCSGHTLSLSWMESARTIWQPRMVKAHHLCQGEDNLARIYQNPIEGALGQGALVYIHIAEVAEKRETSSGTSFVIRQL